MSIFEDLLSKRWIIREQEKEIYYQIKEHAASYQNFFREYLGYNLIIKSNFIKLDKFGVPPQCWMGITEFKNKLSYVFLSLILIFLEDKEEEEQFILSELAEFIQTEFQDEEIEWINYSERTALVDTLKFCVSQRIIKENDGILENYLNDETTQVLYENTGLSKFFVRDFNRDITDINSLEQFEEINFASDYSATETLIRHRVYRKLLMTLAVYNDSENQEDFNYIKRFRTNIQENFSNLFDADLHVHKNAAFLILGEDSNFGKCFPDNTIECNIALLINKHIRDDISAKKIVPDVNSNVRMTEEEFRKTAIDTLNCYKYLFTKKYREMKEDAFVNTISDYLISINFLHKDNGIYIFSPIVGKIIGEYSKDILQEESDE
ncbi:hypothetical protein IX317_001707 [Fusobacterium sp. DD29]|uniref:TIGR02678 family protein n=1 Tax=unclassified Fusobacterium TaxID=2648384 RepID=UPI001B8D70CB|nr:MULTISPECIES: TIGR02678 family protein [unclassified Fusobacterium]MBR8750026.1 hypothetical protein [Fusobacterium sp. DD29]MBR8762268.1 hypothetical protein [Fusobacterium sp. DD25]MBR8768594.1 hypothetical protein [Fusobacterium sp. DD43]MBR8772361.1 hypothetical protein [Fusobacterium sp. DD40]MBR8776580.1 hypothetical protein [Fusobacterium sp. DD17]